MTNRQFRVVLPMRIQTSSRKKTALNLNVYRNLHFRSLSALKNKFHKLSKELLKDIPPLGRIRLHYSVCPQTNKKLDIGNVASIVDKFFSDSLTECDIIEDDNYQYLDRVSFGFGGVVKKEHVLVTITEIEPRKGNAMRILLDDAEINLALTTFVETLGLSGVTGVTLTTDDDGNVIAEILLGESALAATKKPPVKRRGPAKKKEKADVEVPTEDSDAVDSTGGSESTEAEPQETKTPAKTAAGSKSKNLFEESPEESSPGAKGDPKEEEEGGDSKPVKTAKKSSIFDQ